MNDNNTRLVAGREAIALAAQGHALFVRNEQRGLVPAGPLAVERARRMAPHSLWIYVVVLR